MARDPSGMTGARVACNAGQSRPFEEDLIVTTVMEPPTRRPGIVTFIGVILYVQGFLAVMATITMLIWRGAIVDFLAKEGSPLAEGAFTGTIIAEAISAVLLVYVASGIMRGSSGIRLFVALVQCFSMGVAMYILVAHHVGGYVYRGVFSLFVGIFVLWSLYADDEADKFFETNG